MFGKVLQKIESEFSGERGFALAILVYFLCLLPSYGFVLSQRYGYFPELSEFWPILAVLVGAGVYCLGLFSSGSGIGSLISSFGLIVLIVPCSLLFIAEPAVYGPGFAVVISCYLVFLIFCRIKLPAWIESRIPLQKSDSEKWRKLDNLVIGGTLILCLGAFIYGAANGGINFDFRKVYDHRSGMSGRIVLLCSLLGKVFLPFVAVAAVRKGSFFVAAIVVIGAILVFGVSSHKSHLILPLISLAVAYFYSKFDLKDFVGLLTIVIGLATLLHLIADGNGVSNWVYSLGVRRALFVPAFLTFEYVEFFSENTKYLWSTSRISFGLLDNPYDVSIPSLIGESLFQDGTKANVGFIGSGYAQAGILGALIYSIGFGLVVTLFRMFSVSGGEAFAFCLPTLSTIWQSSDFLTAIFSHFGLLVFAMVVVFFRRSSNCSENN